MEVEINTVLMECKYNHASFISSGWYWEIYL